MVKYISVDIESSGPIHGYHSLLEIGAVDCDNTNNTFQCYVKPISVNWSDAARKINKPHEFYVNNGLDIHSVMEKLNAWLNNFGRVVFVGFNAPFDYGWINYSFHTSIGYNPFGINALDIKAYYMGKFDSEWSDTTKKKMKIKSNYKHTHNALDDAIEQADIFNQLRNIK